MTDLPSFPDDELLHDIRRLFRKPHAALAVFRVGAAAFPRDWQRAPLSVTLPTHDRLRMYERELRDQVSLLATQVDEFEGPDLDRLEAEGIAVLIAIRELRLHIPELADVVPKQD